MGDKLLVSKQNGDPVEVQATEDGILYWAPVGMLWTAKGYGYQAKAVTAVAALVVRPGATAMLTLFNNEAGGGKSYVIERVNAHNLVGVAGSSYSIWLCVHPVGMAAPVNDITPRDNTGGRARGGSLAIVDIAATVVDDGWYPWGNSGHAVTVTVPGGVVEAPINKDIILPPQSGLSAHVVADTTGATFTIGFRWFEVPPSELRTSK